jgi:hypothetical protein
VLQPRRPSEKFHKQRIQLDALAEADRARRFMRYSPRGQAAAALPETAMDKHEQLDALRRHNAAVLDRGGHVA